MLIFTKRLFDVFDDELNRIVQEIGGRFMPRAEDRAHRRRSTSTTSSPATGPGTRVSHLRMR
jgi:hypothetical protein